MTHALDVGDLCSQCCHGRFELGNLHVALRLGAVKLRFFERLLRLGFIKILAADGRVGQNSHAVGLHLKDAACDEHVFLRSFRRRDAHGTGTNAGKQRNVSGQNAELAFLTGQSHKAGFPGEDGLFCADDVNKNRSHRLLR